VLASASPRRRDLLRDLGLTFTVHAPDVDERRDVPDDPDRHAAVLAERKAHFAAEKFHECVILAADTIVVLNGRILGKPADEDEAFAMLRALAGREHRVLTGVCVGHAARGRFETRVVSTAVRFRAVDDEELRRYVASGEPMGKAGAYAIQGRGGLLVAGIEGDYSNVVGLPLGATLDLLEETLGLGAGA
jgi:septum formation protein